MRKIQNGDYFAQKFWWFCRDTACRVRETDHIAVGHGTPCPYVLCIFSYLLIYIMEIDFKKLGMRIKEARHRKNITQEKLAVITDLSPNFIARTESNNAKVSLVSLVKICMALDTSMDSFLPINISVPS